MDELSALIYVLQAMTFIAVGAALLCAWKCRA